MCCIIVCKDVFILGRKQNRKVDEIGWLVGWLVVWVCFNNKSTFVGN